MGLYLCIFKGEEELDGLEIGSYADYGHLVDHVVEKLEHGRCGSRFPTLTTHSDCDGEWSPTECAVLEAELSAIITAFKALPAAPFFSEWQAAVAKEVGHKPRNLYETFIDVDGELVLDRLLSLCQQAQRENLPIRFQ